MSLVVEKDQGQKEVIADNVKVDVIRNIAVVTEEIIVDNVKHGKVNLYKFQMKKMIIRLSL